MTDDTPDDGSPIAHEREKTYRRAEANFFRCTCAGCTPDPDIRRYVKTTIHEQPRRVEPR